jgi:beta-phosphoglucomutase-like phosphatase (HAD superfamily)
MKRIKGKVDAIIFDMDGTIIKTEQLWQAATEEALKRRGFLLTHEQKDIHKKLFGAGITLACQIVKSDFNLTDSVEHLCDEVKQIAGEFFKKKIEFVEGFQKFHNKLSELMIPTSIATNCDGITLESLKKKLQLDSFFGERIFGIDLVQNKAKPDPSIFFHAAAQMGANPKRCIVFEDSEAGFQAAKKAGMMCIGIKTEMNTKLLDQTHGNINSYEEAEKLLINLLSTIEK